MPDTEKILENARIAQAAFLRRHTVAIWQECDGKEDRIGSGTCIQIADRLFVSTAAHNFDYVRSGGTITVFSVASGIPVAVRVIGQNYSDYTQPGNEDVAWVELDPQSAAQEGIEGITLDVVDSYHAMDIENGTYAVMGFPPDFRRLGSTPNDVRHIPPVFGYLRSWKNADSKDDKLFFSYPGYAIKDGNAVEMPRPGGLSGGGDWSRPSDEEVREGLWSLAKYRLVGITIEHRHPSGKVEGKIVGVRMYHWLRLLHTDKPELREYLEPLLT